MNRQRPGLWPTITAMLLLMPASQAANLDDPVLERGEEVYRMTCATSYCHGVGGAEAGAPRLAARGFDAGFIAEVTRNGVADTAMAGFTNALPADDLQAVLTYVAQLNGIDDADFGTTGDTPGSATQAARPALTGAAKAGRERFFDSYDKGLARCSTCHEIDGLGISVATPISALPADVSALRNLATRAVGTLTVNGERMPALLLARSINGTVFYDMSVVPPVLRTLAADVDIDFDDDTDWRHADWIRAYDDDELEQVLQFLRAVLE